MSSCLNKDSHYASFSRLALAFVVALALSLCCATAMAPKASAITIADTAPAVTQGKWVKKSKCMYYVTKSGAKAKGLVNIDGKGYYFSSKGIQRTGWRLVKGSYCYFTIANGKKGSLVCNKVVNGIKIQRNGTALVNKTALEELKIMAAAQKRVDKVAKPCASTSAKLRACFKWVWKKCRECSSVKWHNTSGLHRRYAWDILKRHAGSCDSMGCGYAYLANACGASNVKIAASGGHTWSVVYGKVCDIEMAKQTGSWHYYMLPYAGSFYNHNDRYKISIAPRTKLWSKASALKSFAASKAASGWVTSKGKRYYYFNGTKLTKSWLTLKGKKYYFKANGTMAIGSVKVKGTYYVFNAKGVLLTGKKARVVTVLGTSYYVTKAGKAKSGWSGDKKRYYAANGEMMTGVRWISNKLMAFDQKGVYNQSLTRSLQSCCKADQPADALLDLLGPYAKRVVAGSCRGYLHEISYTYDHIVLSTYCKTEGIELFNMIRAR